MMKKLVILLAIASITASASVALAGGAAKTGVNGSMHDINVAGGGTTYAGDQFQRVCAFCHTPHNAIPSGSTPAPLWNHAASTVTLDPYAWASPANAGILITDPLVGPSRLCMGCHDGITAVDSHGSAGSFNGGHTVMSASYPDALGHTTKRYIQDLTVTHPIGFLYQAAETARNANGNTEIVVPTQGYIADNQLVGANFNTNSRGSLTYSNKKISDTLYSGFLTCASCHDVHNSVNAAPASTTTTSYNYFLYAQEEGSAICLSCHIK
jgi:hypothetical protein